MTVTTTHVRSRRLASLKDTFHSLGPPATVRDVRDGQCPHGIARPGKEGEGCLAAPGRVGIALLARGPGDRGARDSCTRHCFLVICRRRLVERGGVSQLSTLARGRGGGALPWRAPLPTEEEDEVQVPQHGLCGGWVGVRVCEPRERVGVAHLEHQDFVHGGNGARGKNQIEGEGPHGVGDPTPPGKTLQPRLDPAVVHIAVGELNRPLDAAPRVDDLGTQVVAPHLHVEAQVVQPLHRMGPNE